MARSSGAAAIHLARKVLGQGKEILFLLRLCLLYYVRVKALIRSTTANRTIRFGQYERLSSRSKTVIVAYVFGSRPPSLRAKATIIVPERRQLGASIAVVKSGTQKMVWELEVK